MFESKSQLLRAMFYAIIAVFALAYMGAISEACADGIVVDGRLECSGRPAGVIAMGVLTAFLSLGALVVAFLNMSIMIEIGLVGVSLITNTAAAAILLSPKTLRYTSVEIVSWTCEALLIATLFLLLGRDVADEPQSKAPQSTPIYASNTSQPAPSTSIPMSQPYPGK